MKQRNNYIDRDQLHQLMRDYKDTGIISEEIMRTTVVSGEQ